MSGNSGNPLLGIGLKVLAVLLSVVMISAIKAADRVPLGQAMFYRSLIAIFPIMAMLAFRRELSGALRTERPIGHLIRGFCSLVAMVGAYYAARQLQLADSITLQYVQPLLLIIFSVLFLGERIKGFQWAAVVIGFSGVLIVTWPNLTIFSDVAADSLEARQKTLGIAAALLGAVAAAAVILQIRSLIVTEKSSTIVLWFSVCTAVMALASWPFGWVVLTPSEWALLALSGICGGVSQLMMAECLRYVSVSTAAPFEYTSIIFGAVIGYLVFSDVPGWTTLVGGGVVAAAGLLVLWGERRKAKV